MRRIFGVAMLAAVLGSAPPALAVPGSVNDPLVGLRRELRTPTADPSQAYARGVAALQARQYKAAAREFGRVVDLTPSNAGAWRALGAAYAGQQKWAASRRAYGRAVYLAPNDVVGHAGLGLALQAQGSPKAQEQAAWLKARAQACAGACPDAAALKALETQGPFAAAAAS